MIIVTLIIAVLMVLVKLRGWQNIKYCYNIKASEEI
jgi:hypothetical protein